MSELGHVVEWNAMEGWGVVESSQTPGGCWVHFSAVAVAGHRFLEVGQKVEFDWEAHGQDGFPYRATRVWPAGEVPFDDAGNQGAYTSRLDLNFDGPTA